MAIIVFTNGCFDIIHPGHVDLLTRAKALGTRLVVGINSDTSVREIRGNGRPFLSHDARKELLEALKPVDEVVIFDELTPERLIKELKPDVLVKGGDWADDELIGGDYVVSKGGRVVRLPLKDGYSSSAIVAKIRDNNPRPKAIENSSLDLSFNEHLAVMGDVRTQLADVVERGGRLIIDTFRNNGKILIFGNGGSAADAQHLAAEFVGRYESDRRSLPAIALTTDTSALTAISNDFGFETVFKRQIDGLANEGDCAIAISTSGNSSNVISAVMTARSRGCSVIGMTGQNGKKLASLSDISLMVPSSRTSRIQEGHILVAHIWCEMVDAAFADGSLPIAQA